MLFANTILFYLHLIVNFDLLFCFMCYYTNRYIGEVLYYILWGTVVML